MASPLASSPTTPTTPTAPATVLLVRALHSFSPATLDDDQSRSQTCLSFQRGQLLRCFNKDPSGWWDGQVVVDAGNSRRGWFPSNYVEVVREVPLVPVSGDTRTTSSLRVCFGFPLYDEEEG